MLRFVAPVEVPGRVSARAPEGVETLVKAPVKVFVEASTEVPGTLFAAVPVEALVEGLAELTVEAFGWGLADAAEMTAVCCSQWGQCAWGTTMYWTNPTVPLPKALSVAAASAVGELFVLQKSTETSQPAASLRTALPRSASTLLADLRHGQNVSDDGAAPCASLNGDGWKGSCTATWHAPWELAPQLQSCYDEAARSTCACLTWHGSASGEASARETILAAETERPCACAWTTSASAAVQRVPHLG
mmetsp:Transcript_47921/g.111085  ORF Transcript_47921/g.111085 Transcript_47921/m.111085 type:complete len:247 (+) Transcript_47921:1180-1920(+)